MTKELSQTPGAVLARGYRIANREAYNARQRARHLHLQLTSAAYREMKKKNARKWSKLNPERQKQFEKNWREKNPEKILAIARASYNRRKQLLK